MSADGIFNVVLGTAGHIDHGKSTLVQALTGIHPDRLKEEQERGITIDLGFAPLTLKNGLRVGIIDVPGHERFIKNMVAGASGIDFVMLVIAADDGVMAQTREHLQILQLLSVRDGLTVITKTDLVEPDFVELVEDDIRALETGTVLDGKPIVRVSSKTGAGLDELRALLETALSKLSRRADNGPFRMPVQRVFAKEGFGTVLTGVPLSGRVALGDTLTVLPPGYNGRVKGLHAYKTAITSGQAGHSTAINLHGPEIDKKEVARGMVVATPGIFKPTTLFSAKLAHLPGAPWPLKHRAAVRFHSGTAEIQGKVLLLTGDTLAPGADGWIQVLLEEPTVLAPGDRFILRHQTPMITLGGGRVIDALAPKLKRQNPVVLAELEQRHSHLDDPPALLADLLHAAQAPMTLPQLSHAAGLLPQQLLPLLDGLIKQKKARALKAGTVYIGTSTLERLFKLVVEQIEVYLKEHPALGGIERPELRFRLSTLAGAACAEYFDEIISVMSSHALVKAEQNAIMLPGRDRKLSGPLAAQAQQVEDAIRSGGLTPPSFSDIETDLRLNPKTLKEIKKYLIETHAIVEIAPEIHFHGTTYEAAKSELLKLFARQAECSMSEIRQALNMNRKFVVPLMEKFDRTGLTVRVGDKRKLAGK
jgi:selenocysteine-specific elongation factor